MKKLLSVLACAGLACLALAVLPSMHYTPVKAQIGGGDIGGPLGGSNQVVVYVKDADSLTDGDHQILYDANRGGGNSVSNRVFVIDEPNGLSVNEINDAIISDARAQTGSPDSASVMVYGGAVRQFVQGPQ